MEYLDVALAQKRDGVKLVLTAGVPGPWGEAAKAVLSTKNIPYHPVRQAGGAVDPELVAWTGRNNAPVVMADGEPPRSGWAEILEWAERHSPKPALVPDDSELRVHMYGLAHTICGEGGFGWLRRLTMFGNALASRDTMPAAARERFENMAAKYGLTPESAQSAFSRSLELLAVLHRQRLAQAEAGSPYFVGHQLSAVDLYWACFATMVAPYDEARCPLGGMRVMYTATEPEMIAALTPELLAHRDFIYANHLALPIEF